ncbi:MAG: AbrB/MazE/SpoVT family DNA-binding domain-containing protein [Proteobacteria bacterium]|nr:AbrB/MazE/SpoVT family DNA-binding domain-containing protein [Pseudomonadota bacterium]
MRITSKGQVTIPLEIREKIGLLPDTEIEFKLAGNKVWLQKSTSRSQRGRNLVARLRGQATVKMTTDEIMSLTRRKASRGNSGR